MTPRTRSPRAKRRFRVGHHLVPSLLPLVIATSCAFADVPVALAEFEPSLPSGHAPSLDGRTVHIAEVVYDGDVAKGWSESEPAEEPEGFAFAEMSDAAEEQWEQLEVSRREAGETGPPIGYVRNGFGMRTADVVALGDPGQWVAEQLRLELAAQGARIVEGDADLTIAATVRHLEVDLYMTTKAHLVVDFVVTPAGGAPRELRLHTYGTATAWWGNAWEYYRAIRSAAQQLLWRFVRDDVLAPGAPSP